MEGEVISASDIYSVGHRPTGVDAMRVAPRRIRPTGDATDVYATSPRSRRGAARPALGGISELPKRRGSSRSVIRSILGSTVACPDRRRP